MSFNQSRSDKSSGGGGDSQYRKSGNPSGNASAASSYQRTNSGKPSVGGGGPPGSYQRANSNSFKKSNNVQGGQSRGSFSSMNAELNNVGVPSRNVQNVVIHQVSSRGVTDVPVSTTSTGTNAAVYVSNINPAGLKSSQSTPVSSNPKPAQTPSKSEGGPPKGFALQFGSVSPGLVNGIQIPPRTTSAPPNLDEQNQAQRDFSRTAPAPAVPLPSIPKHQLPVKEHSVVKHPIAVKILEKESQVSSPTPSSPQKPFVAPLSSVSSQVTTFQPYSSQAPLQFGVRPQFRPQTVPSASHQMPPILPKGNGPLLQQPMFVPSVQPHPMPHHGIMHQGQGLSFPNQLRHQMPHQMSNIGINLGPQFTPPQAGKYGSPRRTVKITYPDTHEELRLSRRGEPVAVVSPKAGIQNTLPPQPQPVMPVVTPSSNYYPSSFGSSVYHPPAMSTIPLSTHITPDLQTARAHYPISQGPLGTVLSDPSAVNKVASSIHGMAESLNKEAAHNLTTGNQSTKQNASSEVDSTTIRVDSEVNQTGSSNAKLLHSANVTTGTPATVASKNSTGADAPVLVKSPTSTHRKSTAASEVSASRSSSVKDQQKKPNHIEQHQSQPQGGGQAIAPPTTSIPSDDRPARITKVTASVALSGPTKLVSIASSEDRVSPDVSGSPKLNVSIKTFSEGSGGQVESLQNKALEQVSGQLNEGTTEDVASKENSSLAIAVEGREAQNGVMESVNVIFPRASEVGFGQAAVTDESKPPTTVSESKGHESLKEVTANYVDGINSIISGSDDKAPIELNRPRSATPKGKKKIKEVLQKADAAGTTSDLYTAYKAPEEKVSVLSTVATGNEFSSGDVKQLSVDTKEDTLAGKNQTRGKIELDNWEDADDVTSPKLKIVDKLNSGSSGSIHDATEMKKYTKDFLMKFKDQCDTLPENFNIPQDLLRALLASNVRSVKVDRSASDRSLGTVRAERREMDDNKWSKGSSSSRELRPDFGHGNNMGRPGSGGNSGGRHPRGQAGQHSGGLLSGPLQSMNSFHRENAEGHRWQRHPNSQRGLFSSPHTPAQMMHKAENKYEVGKVADEEQAKQRQLKGILNKLTPQNFERLFEQVKAVNIDSAVTLTGVISQIFDKALMEPTFCEMYADFCYHLSGQLPDFTEGDQKITFKRVLLNKCQEEFERGEREEEEANKVEEEGEVAQSNEEREEKRVKARRRMLGNIRLIGELYKKRMLTERIMHECIKKLLGPHQNADEEDIEALCKLMSTIGEMIDHPKAKMHMDAYFEMMWGLSNNMKYSSRVRFMLKDSIDLRNNQWQQRRKVEGPKKIEDVHRDAAHERQAQSSRLSRGPSMNLSNRRGTATDFGPRSSSILSSPNSQHGEYRSLSSQARGFGGTQDVRIEDRQPLCEGRNVSVPLPQRGVGSDRVTLGPQGGLARGMSIRGAPPAHITPTPGLNGYRPSNERSAYNSNDNAFPRSTSGRLIVSANSQPSGLEHNLSLENEMRSSGRTTDKSTAIDTALPSQSLSEERLRAMCTSTIKEFYSAKDEKEVALCIKDMNTPSFHPSMVALWVSDSFERKGIERNLLSKLLVSLTKSLDSTLTHNDLLKGFESVLVTLEDAATDAPKAPEFLGHLFATVIVENVIPLLDVREIVHKGGEEPGTLVESGLAGDVIGNILEVIQSEKGDSYLNEIRSSLRLEDFRPPHPLKSKKLEKFL